MADIDEITALVYRYAELLDRGEIDGVVDLVVNADWRSGATGQVRRSRDEVKDVYDRIVLYGRTPRTKHLVTNLVIDVAEGSTEATGRCDFTVLQGIFDGAPIETILAGRYQDRYRRDRDGWHFAERVFITDLVGDQSRHFR
jgi:hypothetical protein